MNDRHEPIDRTLIIGLDASEQGRDALALGRLLAETLAANPLVATVLPYPPDLLSAEELTRAVGFDTETLFNAARERLVPLDSRTRAIVASSAAKGLYQLAEEESAIAIVVGSTHRGQLGRVLPGSVGANLLQGAPCAVAVGPHGYAIDDEHRLHRLTVGFDGSPEAAFALDAACGLAVRVGGALTVVTAVGPPGYGWGEALRVLSEGDLRTREQVEKRETLDRGLERISGGVSVEGRLINGEVADVLAEASTEADLLLVGSRGYGPMRRTLLGSTSAQLMHRAECPVMVLPRSGGDGRFPLLP